MKRKLIIDGNAVYDIDEDCMLKKRMEEKKGNKELEGKKRPQDQNKAKP